jgi:hypothetical protein
VALRASGVQIPFPALTEIGKISGFLGSFLE